MFEFLNRILGYNPQLEVTGLAKCKRALIGVWNLSFSVGCIIALQKDASLLSTP